MTTADRIGRYIGKIPGAVSGNGGHPQTFKVAMVLFNGFGCSEAETLEWLRHYNSKCEPPWSEAELRHKARRRPRRPMTNPVAGCSPASDFRKSGSRCLCSRGNPAQLPATDATVVFHSQHSSWVIHIPMKKTPSF